MRQVVEAIDQMDEECQARFLRGLVVIAALAGDLAFAAAHGKPDGEPVA